MKYRKKPVVIEAIQWNGDNLAELTDWGAPVHILACSDMALLRRNQPARRASRYDGE